MSLHAWPRRKAHFGAVVALVLLPLSLSTSQPVLDTAAVAKPRARAAVSYSSADLALSSRSTTRFALVEQPDDALLLTDGRTKGKARVSGPKGTRVWTASAMSNHNVPRAAERAYRNAARTMASADPACQLPWTLLAGIGRVESDHGRYGGSTLGADGVSHPLIIGIQLNGAGPVAAIRDTDNGRLDEDKVWDRAVGPMQFIPSTWAGSARDGDGDGVRSPNDIDDAALAAAGYLCSGSGSVLGSGMPAAILRYNQDDYYVALVMAFERGYRTGAFVMPAPPAPAADENDRPHKKKQQGKKQHAKPGDHRPAGAKKPGSAATAKPSGATKPKSKKPKTKKPKTKPEKKPDPPSPSAKPTPSGPQLTSVSGTLQPCGSGWCLGSTPLDLGAGVLGDQAADDFDGGGTTGSNADELAGLSGTSVTLQVETKPSGVAVVYLINGMDYRYADGALA